MKDIRVIIILCAVCVLSFSPWSNCLEPRFRSQHSSSAVNYLCSVTRLFVRHCPLLLTTLVSAFRETRRNQYMNFPITRHSVDSSLVTSHDYDTVSWVQHLTAWLWQNTSFQQGMVNHRHPQAIQPESADAASHKRSLFIWHFVSEVLEISVTTPIFQKLRYLSSPFTWLVGWCDCQMLDP